MTPHEFNHSDEIPPLYSVPSYPILSIIRFCLIDFPIRFCTQHTIRNHRSAGAYVAAGFLGGQAI